MWKSICSLLLGLLPLIGLAQIYGCHVQRNGSEVIYYIPYGLGSPNEWITNGVIDMSGAEGGFRNNGSATYGCIKNIGGSCTVYQNYLMTDGVTVGIRVYKTGVYASIDPMNCPIDDYIPFAVLASAGLGVFVLRRRNSNLVG